MISAGDGGGGSPVLTAAGAHLRGRTSLSVESHVVVIHMSGQPRGVHRVGIYKTGSDRGQPDIHVSLRKRRDIGGLDQVAVKKVLDRRRRVPAAKHVIVRERQCLDCLITVSLVSS